MEKELEQDLQLIKVHKRDRRYKWRAVFYKKIAIALGVMLLGVAYLLGMSLRGNLSLAKQLEQAKTTVIMPNGKALTR